MGEAARRLRRERGLTQKELALRMGVPQSWVSNIESGQRRLGLLEALDFCSALSFELAHLVTIYQEGTNAR